MFKLANATEIGGYLKHLILGKYESERQFCRAYLRMQESEETETEVQKMANRISQIIQGNKDIQLTDIPVFSILLGVSPEEILSGGKNHVPVGFHLTNASVARSKKPDVWKKYLSMETEYDVDEYGKTLVEYAVEYKNYELIRYLVENGEIWVQGASRIEQQAFGLGAVFSKMAMQPDTSGWCTLPKKMERGYAPSKLTFSAELRNQAIVLAIETRDVDMLKQMRAREIPEQYIACRGWDLDWNGEYAPEILTALMDADEAVLAYFTEEFTIKDRFGYEERWLTPFFDELLARMLETNHAIAKQMLYTAIKHNQYADDKLQKLFGSILDSYNESYFESEYGRNIVREDIMRDHYLSEDGRWILFVDVQAKERLTTNLIRVDADKCGTELQHMAMEVNEIYKRICGRQPLV